MKPKTIPMLSDLTAKLRQSLSLLQKQDIQTAAQVLKQSKIPLGDDCAAIPDGDGYLLLAAEGMSPQFLETDPWFAGWSAIMVNVSDIYGMGGYPIAVVDTIWSRSASQTEPIWEGMKAASQAYQVPIVGGHTNCHSPYNALSVAILGRAERLITSFNAQSGDLLLAIADFRGNAHPDYPFWNAATEADPARLRENLALLPHLAAMGLCDAGKDISMGGIVGTLLMLLETSHCGAILEIDRIPCPKALSLERWLISFPSFGFLLSVRPQQVDAIRSLFHACDLVCEVVGEVQPTRQLILRSPQESIVFWDLSEERLTGFP
jgi:hypothetical protein